MWSNFAPHDQFFLSCVSKLLHMTRNMCSNLPCRAMTNCSRLQITNLQCLSPCCDLRCYGAKSISSEFTNFCVEKNQPKWKPSSVEQKWQVSCLLFPILISDRHPPPLVGWVILQGRLFSKPWYAASPNTHTHTHLAITTYCSNVSFISWTVRHPLSGTFL